MVSSHSRSWSRWPADSVSRSSIRLTDAATMTSGRRTTYAPEPCRISTRPIRDRLRSAWLTVGRLAPKRSASSRSGGSRAPAPICSLMIRFRICPATESARRAVLTGPIPASSTASGRRCCVMPLTLPERQSDNVAMPLGAGVRVSDPGTRWTVPDPARLATLIRLRAVRMVAPQGFGYLGQALSSAEEVAALFAVARPGVDRMVCSPGHYVIGFYAAAAETGLLPDEALAGYGQDGSALEAIGSERTPVLDYVCGSLGQGLSAAAGFALSDRLRGREARTFALVSDGELEEGQVWEAAMFAAHHRLAALTVLLDANNSQVDGPVDSITTIEPIAAKWAAFGWVTAEVDGHT